MFLRAIAVFTASVFVVGCGVTGLVSGKSSVGAAPTATESGSTSSTGSVGSGGKTASASPSPTVSPNPVPDCTSYSGNSGSAGEKKDDGSSTPDPRCAKKLIVTLQTIADAATGCTANLLASWTPHLDIFSKTPLTFTPLLPVVDATFVKDLPAACATATWNMCDAVVNADGTESCPDSATSFVRATSTSAALLNAAANPGTSVRVRFALGGFFDVTVGIILVPKAAAAN